MTDQQWRRAWNLYQTASTLPRNERDAFIDSASPDPEVRCEIRMMLTESDEGRPPGADAISEAVAAAAAGVVRHGQIPSPPVNPRQGESFGRYRIVRVVGRGGMGEIYEAADPELDRSVALKFLPAGSLDQPAAMARFNREARSLSAINHPNIVTVHEVIQESGQIAIVMELVEGQPLRHLCGPGAMSLTRLAHIGLQIARALEAAHARGVIHGDIKPENVMVRPDGYAKVLDFGLARRVQPAGEGEVTDAMQQGQPGAIGTFRYMAPEQLRNEPATPASDLYSLGLLLYEMASGRHPFGGTTAFSALKGNAPKLPAPLHQQHPELPASLDDLILAMLPRDPANRISSAEAVALLEELARTADPRNVNTGRRALAATVCGAAAVLAGTLWWGAASTPAGPPVQIRPLTSQMGRETEPVFSPDGNWIAYLWAGDSGKNPGLYVRSFKSDAPKLLASGSSPHPIRAIVFSPDGARIAFRRNDGIFAIARNGSGSAVKLATSEDRCQGSGLDWSPDGSALLLAECPAGFPIPVVMQVELASGHRRQLTSPPASTQGDFDPHYSPAGTQVAFRRALQPVVEDLYVLKLGSKDPIAISRDARGLAGLAWMPDGKSILVSSQRSSGIYGLWRFYLDKPFKPETFAQAGQHAKAPAVARLGGRAAWINQVIDHNIWEIPFDAAGGTPKRIISSLQRDVDGNIGPDGRIAFRSDRSGVSEIWIAAPDGSAPVRVTSMDGPLTGTPRWSPDGKHLAFDSRPASNPDIYLLHCDASVCQGPPRRLTDDPSSDVMPSWSRDGKSIYFGSSRTGRREVWKLSLEDGAKPEQITRNGGYLGIESADGRWLYYSKIVQHHGIWRKPLRGAGAEEQVAEPFDDYGAGSWLLAPGDKEIVYLGSGQDTGIRAWNIVTRKSRLLHDVKDRAIERGLSVSPDGRRLIYSQLDRSDSNVMIAEGIR